MDLYLYFFKEFKFILILFKLYFLSLKILLESLIVLVVIFMLFILYFFFVNFISLFNLGYKRGFFLVNLIFVIFCLVIVFIINL